MNNPKNTLGKYPWLEQLSTQALEDLLRQDFAAGEGHSDPDFVAAILEVIAQRTPDEALPVDTDAAWASLRARTLDKPHDPAPTEEEPKVEPFPTPKRRRPRRPWVVAAVVCLLVCLLAVPVQGQSLLESLVSWTGSTFTFLPQEDTGEEPANLPSLADPSFSAREEFSDDEIYSKVVYQQVEEAVADLTDRPVLPTWYPEGSLLTRVEENPMDDGYMLLAAFSLNGEEFHICVTAYNSEEEMDTANYEKNEGSPEEYYVNGIPHYIMGNMARNVAIWRNGTVECSIQGFLTVDQLKQMIDSIYA
ncbi:MAG TPA: DUF4367 domain-containing protein [Candidatus Evtepia faecavium]|nr:DUF4367 domain-containing protein [Candidatus Evtepia faecavium]